jgi:hypothetical protein
MNFGRRSVRIKVLGYGKISRQRAPWRKARKTRAKRR